jgi:hypothetical protein
MNNAKSVSNQIKSDKTIEAIVTAVVTFGLLLGAVILEHGLTTLIITLNPIYFMLTFWMNPISFYLLVGLNVVFLLVVHIILWRTMKGFFWKGVITGQAYVTLFLFLGTLLTR